MTKLTSAILGGAAALLMAGAAAAPASAATLIKPAGVTADRAPLAEKVDYRRCVWRHGHRECFIVRTHPRRYYDGPRLGFYYGRPWGPTPWGWRHHRRW
jgi:hypothetical protein